ncbi:predicted transporter [Halarchaeum acidiphilum MH1-52-1]|uniref:Predicted transporter n=1 Tax=Halarchaeum acidiphilum MH1-52-1 TaxID=1261545 RepID=U2YWD6_9EURY|nr:AEC family transporter [Halarchaeum acidiphilum]GAD53330.1 predicted transporter [Halarchaeum acidiphilum MH1-52-1]
MTFVSALTSAILPVLLVAGVGFTLGRVHDVQVDALGTVAVYVLTPCLVFYSLATTTLGSGAVAKIAVGVLGYIVVMTAVAEGAARVLGLGEPHRGAFVLSSTFPNGGNYGIPLARFAFGPVGQSVAVLYIVAVDVLQYTLGVFLAARGGEGDLRESITEIFRLPLLYGLLAAVAARLLGVVPATDTALMQTIQLVGNAAIPVMLLMLGIQLANTRSGPSLTRAGIPTVLKLGVAPVIAVALALGLAFADGDVARVFVLECAMPAAVTPLVLTIEFSGDTETAFSAPEYVSTVIFTTTVCSTATLAVLIWALRDGLLGI